MVGCLFVNSGKKDRSNGSNSQVRIQIVRYRTGKCFRYQYFEGRGRGHSEINHNKTQIHNYFVQKQKNFPKDKLNFYFLFTACKRAGPRVISGIILHTGNKYEILVVGCQVVGNLKFCGTISYKHTTLYDQPMYGTFKTLPGTRSHKNLCS